MSSSNEEINQGADNNNEVAQPSPTENQQTLDSIETELNGIEAQLRPSLTSVAAAASSTAGGRLVRESIRSALGSIRSRLGRVEALPEHSFQETQSMNNLSTRLRNAEIAHSNRIPLGVLQRELSRRQSVAHTTEKQEHQASEHVVAPPHGRRRSSVLLASRRMAEEAQGHAADMDLHGTANVGMSGVETIAEESTDGSIKVNVVHDEPSIKEQEDEEMEDVESPDKHELPILLTQSSFSRLDSARRSVLFGSGTDLLQQATSAATVVYSWGAGVNSLHDDADDKKAANSRVKPDSRIGTRDVSSASIGHYHAACSTSTGEVLICGRNTAGAVDPDRKTEDVIARPILLESLSMSRIVQVSCGLDHTAALRSNGAVLTWGSNEYGQLGHRMPFRRPEAPPLDPTSLKFCKPKVMVLGAGRRATSVACGDCFTLVLTSRMSLLACGVEIVSGRSKKEGEIHLPAPIPALEDLPLVTIAAGRRHAVAVSAHGSAFAWGENSNGCLGRQFPKATYVPVPIKVTTEKSSPCGFPEPLTNWDYWNGNDGHVSLADDIAVVDAACGDEHTVLVTRSGRLLVCGNNNQGQLGIDPAVQTLVNKAEPVNHPSVGRSFVSAEAGEAHTLVLDDAGDVWQLGGDSGSSKPELVIGKKAVGWIAAGGKQNLAVAAAVGRTLPNREFSDEGGDDVVALTRGRSVEDLLAVAHPQDKKIKDEEECELGEAEIEIGNRTEELLKTPAVLNSLFLDPAEFDDLFGQLLSTDSIPFQQCIASSVEKGMRQGLETLRSDDARLIYPEQVRFLLLYIQCPLFLTWKDSEVLFDRRGDLIMLLCETILGLSYEGYKAFLSWATSIYPQGVFARLLIRPLLSQLEKCFTVSAGAERRPVPAIVAVLRWLHNASERAGNASPEDFYCEALGELDPRWVVEDLFALKDASKHERASNFFICDNPFLFSPTAKRSLLQFESEVNMLKIATRKATYNEEEHTYEIDPFYVLEIERENLLSQTLAKVGKAEPLDLRKKLRIKFVGEEGIDAGGVTREFFQLLCAQLFDDSSGMWSESLAADQITWFNPDCVWNDEGYYLVGILVGLAVYNSVLLDVHFPQAIYRKLLGESLGFEDLVDHEVKNGLKLLLDYEGDDVEDIFCLTFDVNWMDLGEEKRRELKPGGSNIAVTSSNKEEYVMLYVKWLLVDSINPQYSAFEEGFRRVMEDSSLDLLRPEDLELLVVGSPELDFDALETNTEYEGGYDSDSPVIRHFWHFTKNASPDTQLKLLRFTTGSVKAPIGGLGELAFKIQKAGPDSMQLPSSHTCFNTLLLPDYGDNYEKLEGLLGRAIIECEGFGLQ